MFLEAYVAGLNPGSFIERQAALDVADKAWRLTRAQRWEAEGYSAAEYATRDAVIGAYTRDRAIRLRRQAEAVRQLPDPAASDDDLGWAMNTLGFTVGMSEEDLEWLEGAERPALVEALTMLISEHFASEEEAAAHLEASAEHYEATAGEVEDMYRPDVIRREMEGSFARNVERLVAHASRELDRALKRYDILVDRFAAVGGDPTGDDQNHEPGDPVRPEEGDDQESGDAVESDEGDQPRPAGAADEFDIWAAVTADEPVDYLTNLTTAATDPPTRNEPTEGNAPM